MPASADELALARSWIGTTETDTAFNARYDRLAAMYADEITLDRAIEESLRSQLAVMVLDQPAQFSIEDLSMGYGDNIRALQAVLENFLASGGTAADEEGLGGPLVPNVTKLYRPDAR